ncbi:MAG: type II toxin-antitoxin system HipA family toxin, partial [Gemmatimonadales bacterium]
MTLNGKTDGFTRADLLALGAVAGLRQDGARIIDHVVAAMGKWHEYAAAAGVPADRIAAIAAQQRLL